MAQLIIGLKEIIEVKDKLKLLRSSAKSMKKANPGYSGEGDVADAEWEIIKQYELIYEVLIQLIDNSVYFMEQADENFTKLDNIRFFSDVTKLKK